jgi:hypothetical protein
MDGELKWFAGLLGEVRDCQVQQRRFTDALDGFPDDLIFGPRLGRLCAKRLDRTEESWGRGGPPPGGTTTKRCCH